MQSYYHTHIPTYAKLTKLKCNLSAHSGTTNLKLSQDSEDNRGFSQEFRLIPRFRQGFIFESRDNLAESRDEW